MNVQATNKSAEKSNPKTNTAKPGADQEKVINQFRQEIRTLARLSRRCSRSRKPKRSFL
jgi:hypothetical protein